MLGTGLIKTNVSISNVIQTYYDCYLLYSLIESYINFLVTLVYNTVIIIMLTSIIIDSEFH